VASFAKIALRRRGLSIEGPPTGSGLSRGGPEHRSPGVARVPRRRVVSFADPDAGAAEIRGGGLSREVGPGGGVSREGSTKTKYAPLGTPPDSRGKFRERASAGDRERSRTASLHSRLVGWSVGRSPVRYGVNIMMEIYHFQ
jgi:hypothetical protein